MVDIKTSIENGEPGPFLWACANPESSRLLRHLDDGGKVECDVRRALN